ncbi:MAG TPA: tetratricopeptide repeat protein [Anaerolineales bacterium]|nr:tetratricopeptide repeat protein [Anaerolineales bacterium]
MNNILESDTESTNVDEISREVFEELSMANEAGLPSVLFVLYGIPQDKEDAKIKLRPMLAEVGLKPLVFSFEMYTEHLKKGLPCFSETENMVCIDVSKLNRGKGNVRELINVLAANKNKIVENRIKLVVWMTCDEAVEFSHTSPELWSFRHRMFDLNLNYCAISVEEEEEKARDRYNVFHNSFEQLGEGLVNLDEDSSPQVSIPSIQTTLTKVTLALINRDLELASGLIHEGSVLAEDLRDQKLIELFVRASDFVNHEMTASHSDGEPVKVEKHTIIVENQNELVSESDLLAESEQFHRAGDRFSAIKTLTDHLDSNPGSDLIWAKLGDLYFDYGIFDKALDAYNCIACGCLDLISLNIKKAECLISIGNGDKAVEILKKTLRGTRDENELVRLWKKVGDVYKRMGKNEEAIAAYSYADHRELASTRPMKSLAEKKCIVNSVNLSAEMWNEIGNIFHKTSDVEEAITAYQRSIELKPGNGYAYGNLAQVFSKMGNHKKAIQVLQNGIKQAKEKMQICALWNLLGDEFRLEGNYQEAMLSYKNADLIRTGSRLILETKNYSNYAANVRF